MAAIEAVTAWHPWRPSGVMVSGLLLEGETESDPHGDLTLPKSRTIP